MKKYLRSASLLFAVSVVAGCNDNDNNLDASTTPTGFVSANLAADQSGVAANTNPTLVNSWGLAMDSSSFWIANNGTGRLAVLAADGSPSKFAPDASVLDVSSSITGIVANTTSGFQIGANNNVAPAQALVASQSGQIFAINSSVASTPQLVIDRSAAGAVYTGLAIYTASDGSTRLAAADFRHARIDVFDASFNLLANVTIVGPNLRAGLAPFNLYASGSNLYVSYAIQDASGANPVLGGGNGRIDVFNVDGGFLSTLVDGDGLDAPWGMALAPATFSPNLEGDLIVGNFGDGTLVAIKPTPGVAAQLLTPSGAPLIIPGVWGLAFGNGQVGASNSLYFASGPQSETHGLFGQIVLGPTAPI